MPHRGAKATSDGLMKRKYDKYFERETFCWLCGRSFKSVVCCRFCRSPRCCGQAKLQIFWVGFGRKFDRRQFRNFVNLVAECCRNVRKMRWFHLRDLHVSYMILHCYIWISNAETALIECVSRGRFLTNTSNIKQREFQTKTLERLDSCRCFFLQPFATSCCLV